jgi:hypothetical protein
MEAVQMTWIIWVCAGLSAACVAVFAALRAYYSKKARDIDGFVGVREDEDAAAVFVAEEE